MGTVPATVNRRAAAHPVMAGIRHAAGGVVSALRFLSRPRNRTLDARLLPDHLRRDIGMLDGNDPRGPRP